MYNTYGPIETHVQTYIESRIFKAFFFSNLFYLIYFWLCWVFVAARGLFSSCREQGLLFVVVRRLLIAVASLVAEHGLQVRRLQ